MISYLLPRVALVIALWGMSCALIKNLWPPADSVIFAVAGISWAIAGAAYFAYLRKLKREIEELEHNYRVRMARRIEA